MSLPAAKRKDSELLTKNQLKGAFGKHQTIYEVNEEVREVSDE
jgi:hypothetical protein